MKPKPTIVFDYGDVLIADRSDDKVVKQLLRRQPKNQQKIYEKAIEASETDKISHREMFKTIQQTIFPEKSFRWVSHFYMFTRVLAPWKLAFKLKKHHRVIIFSNNHRGWPQRVARHFRISFRGIPFVNSANVGMRKPDMKFYKYFVKEYKLIPRETIFIDDRPENLVPAKKLGFKTFRYHNNLAELKQWLKKQGVTGI